MEMLHDASPGGLAEVDPDVEAVRFHDGPQGGQAALDQFHQVQQLFIDQLGEVADLSVGHNHEVAAVVRIVVEQGEAAAVARDHVVSDIVVRLGDLGEEADFRGRWFGRQDVLDSPRGVETFHAAKLEGQCRKVKAAVDLRFAIADIANRKSNIPRQAACFFWTSRLRST